MPQQETGRWLPRPWVGGGALPGGPWVGLAGKQVWLQQWRPRDSETQTPGPWGSLPPESQHPRPPDSGSCFWTQLLQKQEKTVWSAVCLALSPSSSAPGGCCPSGTRHVCTSRLLRGQWSPPLSGGEAPRPAAGGVVPCRVLHSASNFHHHSSWCCCQCGF